ncbi:MAG: hypothetical protein U0573_09155 [Phycisphaerales bacterium]|nr:hypothetical protein [Planctomycetota bacterium]
MKRVGVLALCMSVAAIGLAGCAQDARHRSAAPSADNEYPGLLSEEQVTMKLEGTYYTVAQTERKNWRREVLKFTPQASGGRVAANQYCLVASSNQRGTGGVLNWQTSAAQRLYKGGVRTTDEATEPAFELGEEGTVATSGAGPIVIVKRATVSSEGTKFIIEAVPQGGWTIAVIEASKNVDIYYGTTEDPLSLKAGDCYAFKDRANSVKDGVSSPQDFARLSGYANLLWAATGSN